MTYAGPGAEVGRHSGEGANFYISLSRYRALGHFHEMGLEEEAGESLLGRLRSADGSTFERAFREVYAAEKAVVYGLLSRLSGDPDAAADLFQNVWLKLARHRHRLRDDTVLRAWLCTVARREYLNHRRAQTLDLGRLLAFGREPLPEGPTGEPQLLEVNAALQRLSDADRELLLMTSVDGLSPRQAASAVGVNEAALRQRVSRARRRLVAVLESEGPWSRLQTWLQLAKKELP